MCKPFNRKRYSTGTIRASRSYFFFFFFIRSHSSSFKGSSNARAKHIIFSAPVYTYVAYLRIRMLRVRVARFLKGRCKLRFHFASTALVLLRYTFSNSFLMPSTYKHTSIRSAGIASFSFFCFSHCSWHEGGARIKSRYGMSKYYPGTFSIRSARNIENLFQSVVFVSLSNLVSAVGYLGRYVKRA